MSWKYAEKFCASMLHVLITYFHIKTIQTLLLHQVLSDFVPLTYIGRASSNSNLDSAPEESLGKGVKIHRNIRSLS